MYIVWKIILNKIIQIIPTSNHYSAGGYNKNRNAFIILPILTTNLKFYKIALCF